MNKFKGSAAMIAAPILWGTAFSAQSSGMRYIGPMLFTALRSLIAVPALLAVIIALDLFAGRKVSLWGETQSKEAQKKLLAGGFWCGLVIAAAAICQQAGLQYTTAGKTGFLTALYIIIVPMLGIFFKRKTGLMLWISALLALAGSALLCGGLGSLGKGEILVIICAGIYSVHILVIDHYAPSCDCIRLSCLQFAVATPIAALASLAAGESWHPDGILASWPFWLYCGAGSGAAAFTLQMISQKYLHPVTASLLMSLESVFAVLGGWLFLNERLSAREMAGCAVIFAAIILSQVKISSIRRKKD